MVAPPDGIEIDRPELGELDTLVGLWKALVRDQRGYGTTIRVETNEAAARSWLSGRMTLDGVRVARDDSELVGFVTFGMMADRFDRDGQEGIVHNLFVRANFRGQGIGSALLARAEALLADRGVAAVRLEILAANEAAGSFYRARDYGPHRIAFRKPLPDDG